MKDSIKYGLIGVFIGATIIGQMLPGGLFTQPYPDMANNEYRYSKAVQGVDYRQLEGTKFYDIKVNADAMDNHTVCYADFKKPHASLGTATVTDVIYERGFIMGKYYIKEHGGRWYYQDFFENFRCEEKDRKVQT